MAQKCEKPRKKAQFSANGSLKIGQDHNILWLNNRLTTILKILSKTLENLNTI
ncbi:MAG: hypothetical protein K2J83_05810 [Clostridia bacterium]|nr:hypothetical protein [Clostridia bacterium]